MKKKSSQSSGPQISTFYGYIPYSIGNLTKQREPELFLSLHSVSTLVLAASRKLGRIVLIRVEGFRV